MDRAKNFYVEQIGFNVDIDHRISDEVRMIQLTAPGSACSIHLGGSDMAPGSIKSLFLVVPDVRAARTHLVDGGVDVSEVHVFDKGSYRPSLEGDNLDNVGCVFFGDPDGNGWVVQQIPVRDRPCRRDLHRSGEKTSRTRSEFDTRSASDAAHFADRCATSASHLMN